MLPILNYITWNVSPFIYEGEHFAIGWYGTLWTLGLIGMLVTLLLTFKHDKVPTQYALITFMISLVCVIFFGHIFHGLFYEWYYSPEAPSHYLGIEWNYRNDFLDHPWKFIDFAHGGFASHGTTLGIFIAGMIVSRILPCDKWYIADRTTIGLGFIGAFVRLGNLINTEICGQPTTLPWGFVFEGQDFAQHPTQLYELLVAILVIIIGFVMLYKFNAGEKRGLIFGTITFIGMALRILIEFYKLPQMQIEKTWVLNMGQILSIPFAIWGLRIIVKSLKMRSK